jgi:hypothetical protein
VNVAGNRCHAAADAPAQVSVTVNRHGVVVSELGSEFSVTYRREGSVLVADDLMRKTDPSAEQMVFLVQAWKAAFAKAQSLGWLY